MYTRNTYCCNLQQPTTLTTRDTLHGPAVVLLQLISTVSWLEVDWATTGIAADAAAVTTATVLVLVPLCVASMFQFVCMGKTGKCYLVF